VIIDFCVFCFKNSGKEYFPADNDIGKEGIEGLCEAMKANSTLTDLNTDCKNIVIVDGYQHMIFLIDRQ